jgi:hypothetical protein
MLMSGYNDYSNFNGKWNKMRFFPFPNVIFISSWG